MECIYLFYFTPLLNDYDEYMCVQEHFRFETFRVGKSCIFSLEVNS